MYSEKYYFIFLEDTTIQGITCSQYYLVKLCNIKIVVNLKPLLKVLNLVLLTFSEFTTKKILPYTYLVNQEIFSTRGCDLELISHLFK